MEWTKKTRLIFYSVVLGSVISVFSGFDGPYKSLFPDKKKPKVKMRCGTGMASNKQLIQQKTAAAIKQEKQRILNELQQAEADETDELCPECKEISFEN